MLVLTCIMLARLEDTERLTRSEFDHHVTVMQNQVGNILSNYQRKQCEACERPKCAHQVL